MPDLQLGAPFSNHLVLQRGQENPIWGWDLPGQRVVITLESGKRSYHEISTIAGSDGIWKVRLPVLADGGPYRIQVNGSTRVDITDVLVGEVWLASGQSNMEWTIAHVEQAEAVVADAKFGQIRVLKVPNAASSAPEDRFDAGWAVCGPESVGDFTAVGYFFARDLHRTLGVPIGIIDASWGGTYIEAWTSLEGLRPVMPELAEELAVMARESTQIDRIREEYLRRVKEWERDSLPSDPGNLGILDGWSSEYFDDGDWKEMTLPRFWQSEGLNHNGVVWFRKTIELPKSWAGRELLLRLGAIDDFDQTYFNGVLIGEHPDGTPDAYRIQREYRVSGSIVRPGRNVIAVRVFDHCGEGGFTGPKTAMTISKADGSTKILPLAGGWRYAVELEIPLVSLQVFRSFPPPPRILAEQHAPGALFHAMIAPLLPFGLRGILWYQGENNVEQYDRYRDRLVALIRDWRTRFCQGTLPFLLVQLAGFRATSAWPYLREAQHQACNEPGVEMITAIDLGDPDDIHPRNKHAVGQRLASVALHHVYAHEQVACHGPTFRRFTVEGSSIRVHFSHSAGLRTTDGCAQVKGFELAGPNGVYHAAAAHIDSDQVVVHLDGVEWPVSVRYAWRDFPEINLVNAAGLPALPFRTDGAAVR